LRPAVWQRVREDLVDINGVKQGMVIHGRDVRHPVLLWVHGGPGMPDYLMTGQNQRQRFNQDRIYLLGHSWGS
jgi:hypothetical protein